MTKRFTFGLKEEFVIEEENQLEAWKELSDQLKELVEQAEECDFTVGTDLFDIFNVAELPNINNVKKENES